MPQHPPFPLIMSPRIRRSGAVTVRIVVILVVAALVVTVVAAMKHRRNAQRAAAVATPAQPAQPVPAEVMGELANIPAAAWQQAGTRGAATPIFAGDSNISGGKPVVLYIGAGYCPYCAAARWSLITSLARFGTFSGLTLGNSSPIDVYANSPTFSFHGSSYTSDYVVFEPVELEGEVPQADGRYPPLEQPTPAQQALLDKYDKPPYTPAGGAGGIPFILVGGKYMWSGSPFDPGVIAGKSQAAIAGTLAQVSGNAAAPILANANVVTASICAVDGGKPADVCSSPVIRSAAEALPKKTP